MSVRTGELFTRHFLFNVPGKLSDFEVSFLHRSMLTGYSQIGRQWIPSFENVLKTSGNNVYWYRPDGLVVTYVWGGSSYSTTDCLVTTTLTTNGSGRFVLTHKTGEKMTFDANGYPDKYDDTNGNQLDFTYDSVGKWTGLTDTRSKTYTIVQNANGFISTITDPASRTWTLGYDGSDNLTTVTTPATADQASGITTTYGYDGSNRLTSIQDGRGNTVYSYAYVTGTTQIDTVTINGDVVDYAYFTGRTERTDRNGKLWRYHYSGKDITQTDMWVAGAAKYVTTYTYSGNLLSHVVYPRGNRIEYTYDGSNNLRYRRHKQTNTSSNSSNDLLHEWIYTSNRVTAYVDPLGNRTDYTRDSTTGNVTRIDFQTVSNPATQTAYETREYNTSGQLTKITDAEGKEKTFTYFSSGANVHLLEKVRVDPSGLDLTTTYGYDSTWNVSTVTDPRSKTTTTTWDNLRRKTQVQAPSPLSYLTKWSYDGNGNITQMDVENRDKDNNSVTANPWFTTTYTYSATDRRLTVIEEIDTSTTRTTTFEYDDQDQRIRVVKPEGNKEKWTYNERGWVVSHVRGETDTNASTVEYEYDENGNRTVVEDGRDYDTTTTYDLFDRSTRVTDPAGHYEERTLDKNGNATEIARKDSSNVTLQRRSQYFDERNRLWKTSDLYKDPSQTYSDAVTTIHRNKVGAIWKVNNPRSKDTTYTFDNAHRLTKTTDHMGNEWSQTLDANGNHTAWSILEKDGASNITHNYEATYDALNRRTEKVEIDRVTTTNRWSTSYCYDSRSNLVFQVNAEGNPTRYTFDGLSRMLKREVALAFSPTINDFTSAQVTQWAFDKNDRLTSYKDDADNNVTSTYDALDRRTAVTYPNSTSVGYTYDKNDNVTQLIDAAGNDVDDAYNSLNQNTSRSVTRATGFIDTTTETRTFDALGRPLTNEDNDYKLEYTYAVVGLSSFPYEEKQSHVGGSANTKTVTKTYNANGNKATEVYPSGLALAYTYNDVDRVSGVSDGTNTIASFSYIGVRPKVVTYQNGTTSTYTYSGFRQEVATLHHQTSAPATLLRLDYGYNKVHDRTYERFGIFGSSGDGFAYDKARRLTTAWMGSVTPENPANAQYVKKIQYNYDDDGNRTSVVTTLWNQTPTTSSYTTNSIDEYTAVGGTTHSYDANGNLTNNGTYTFKYNYRNLVCEVRLVSGGSVVATYTYDPAGRRVGKVVTSGVSQRFVYAEARNVAIYDGSNNWKKDFIFDEPSGGGGGGGGCNCGGDPAGGGCLGGGCGGGDGACGGGPGLIMLTQADVLDFDSDSNFTETTRLFYHSNAVGSTMVISDMNQVEAVSYRYTPYGELSITRGGLPEPSDPLAQDITFLGHANNPETLLYCMGSSQLSPTLGRFLQPLVQLEVGSRYEFAESNPTSASDASSLYCVMGLPCSGPCGGKADAEKHEELPLGPPVPGPFGRGETVQTVVPSYVAAQLPATYADSHHVPSAEEKAQVEAAKVQAKKFAKAKADKQCADKSGRKGCTCEGGTYRQTNSAPFFKPFGGSAKGRGKIVTGQLSISMAYEDGQCTEGGGGAQ